MGRKLLRDEQWERIRDILPGKAGDPGATARENRLFVEALFIDITILQSNQAVSLHRRQIRKARP